jgi:thioesterase domain-containing protein
MFCLGRLCEPVITSSSQIGRYALTKMTHSSNPIIFFPGTGGEIPSFSGFIVGCSDALRFEALTYPGWQQYASETFSIEDLIADLEAQVLVKIPEGPIRIVGYSIGGHFGYATALRLRAKGREIAGFCAIDSFMIESLRPSANWKTRAVSEALEILRKGQLREFDRFIRSKFWRGLFRLAGGRLRGVVQGLPLNRFLSVCAFDPILEKELNLRLLTQAVAPWAASLDREPVVLYAQASLLRTVQTACDDAAWRRRCPNIEIFEIQGQHQTLLLADDIGSLQEVFSAATRSWYANASTHKP